MEKETLPSKQEIQESNELIKKITKWVDMIKDVFESLLYDTTINHDLQYLASLLIDLKKRYKDIGVEEALSNEKKSPDELYQCFLHAYDFVDHYNIKDAEILKREYQLAYRTREYTENEYLEIKQVKCLYDGAGFIIGKMWQLQERYLHNNTMKQLRQRSGEETNYFLTQEETVAIKTFFNDIVQQIPMIESYIMTAKDLGSPKTQKAVQQYLQTN